MITAEGQMAAAPPSKPGKYIPPVFRAKAASAAAAAATGAEDRPSQAPTASPASGDVAPTRSGSRPSSAWGPAPRGPTSAASSMPLSGGSSGGGGMMRGGSRVSNFGGDRGSGGEARVGNNRWQNDTVDSGPSGGGGGFRGGFGGGRSDNFGGGGRSFGGGGGGGGNSRWMDSERPRTSQTGTGWDVRDGRRWRTETLTDVFKKDKDKATGINFDSYDAIPVELSGNGASTIQPILSFRDAEGVHPLLAENIRRVDYERPTPVQKHSIPVVLRGRDLMACAQTGSGKTAAFLFPIITRMLNEGPPLTPPMEGFRSFPPAYPVALVLSPTRELAVQIFEESKKFAYNTGVRTVVVYGGNDVKNQFSELDRGCDICVATPGRLSDLMKRARVGLQLIKYLVLDEADRMLDMGFSPQIYSIVEDYDMPSPAQGRQTVMFSATFPSSIQQLASNFLQEYIFLTVGRVGSTNDFIVQNLMYADEWSKPKKLLSLLDDSKGGLVLVFVETRKKADLIEDFLLENKLPAVSIHGDRSQQERELALQLFRTGQRSILVATDIAARGLDIHNIAHVINCDLPTKVDDYVHRIGRTGRAGNRGRATSFVNESNRPILRDLLGLLEESGQEVQSWFYDMVRGCTSASSGRGFGGGGSGGGSFFQNRAKGGAGREGPAFGSRDIRSGAGGGAGGGVSTFGGGSRFGDRADNAQRWGRGGGGGGAIVEDGGEDGW